MLRRQRVGLLSALISFSDNHLFSCMAASSSLLCCGSCSSSDVFIYKRSNVLPLTTIDSIRSAGVGKFRINGRCIDGFTTSFRFKCCCSDSQYSNFSMKGNTINTDVKRTLFNGVHHIDNGAYQRGKVLPERVVVAVDVDEVLGNFVSALNRFIADRYSSNHSISEYHVYEFFKIWNCSRDEADIRVHEFFKTSYFKTGIHPIPGAQQALQKLSRFCNLSIVTSRQNAIKDHTIEWIEKHYPGLFQEIHFGNHFALDGQSRPKSEICRSLGAKVLIDDNPRYAIECAEVGIKVLLFDYQNSYPWCKTESVDQHPLVTKVHNWEEVEQHLVSCFVK